MFVARAESSTTLRVWTCEPDGSAKVKDFTNDPFHIDTQGAIQTICVSTSGHSLLDTDELNISEYISLPQVNSSATKCVDCGF